MQQEIRLQRRAKRSLQCSRDITKGIREGISLPIRFLVPISQSHRFLGPARDLHPATLSLPIPYIFAPRTSLCFIPSADCCQISLLAQRHQPSKRCATCPFAADYLLTTIPANSDQSLRHIPYASVCNPVSSSMYLCYAITRSTDFLTTCRETRPELLALD